MRYCSTDERSVRCRYAPVVRCAACWRKVVGGPNSWHTSMGTRCNRVISKTSIGTITREWKNAGCLEPLQLADVGILFIRRLFISTDSTITINDETVTYEFLSTEDGVHHRHIRRTRIRRDRKHQYTGFGCRCRVVRHGGGLNPMNVYADMSIRQGHGHAGRRRRYEQQRALARAPTRAGGSVHDSWDV
jgi:hypothetical protein